MSTPVPTRLSDAEIAVIDRLVLEGIGSTRSDVIRMAIAGLDEAVRRRRVGETIAESYRLRPQSSTDDAVAMENAIALVDAEPWR